MKKFYGAILGALLAHSVPASAQWLTYPEANIPRKNGKLEVDAPTPRLPGGKPNLAGMWKRFLDAQDFAEASAGGIKNRREIGALSKLGMDAAVGMAMYKNRLR